MRGRYTNISASKFLTRCYFFALFIAMLYQVQDQIFRRVYIYSCICLGLSHIVWCSFIIFIAFSIPDYFPQFPLSNHDILLNWRISPKSYFLWDTFSSRVGELHYCCLTITGLHSLAICWVGGGAGHAYPSGVPDVTPGFVREHILMGL